MASLLSHPAFPVALFASKMGEKVSRPFLYFCCFLTWLPDADVLAFSFGIPYHSQWGHRGFTHSIFFAVCIGAICTFLLRQFPYQKKTLFFWTFFSVLSHSLFDGMTNGGLGVAIFWPITSERYFLPWQIIEVSPIGIKNFLSLRGLEVLISEVVWLWLPGLLMAFVIRIFKRKAIIS